MNPTLNSPASIARPSLHRRNASLAGFTRISHESDVSMKIGRISVVSTKSYGNGGDDLLSFGDGAKHDYDWLLTPPGTPTLPPDRNEPQQLAQRSNSVSKSTPTTMKSSRLSVGKAEGVNRPRSSSVTRSSTVTPTHSNPFSSSRPSPALNTSSISLSSYLRSTASVTRPSTVSSRPTSSRPSTTSKARPLSGSVDRARPSTPTPRSQRHPSPSSPVTRPNSRPSNPGPRPRVMSNGSNPTPPVCRSNSPSPKFRSLPHDFPTETPPNLRTTLPDRPLSAGRSRPGISTDTVNGGTRRKPSPAVTRGRSMEPVLGKSRGHCNGRVADPEGRRVPEPGARKSVSTTTVAANNSSSFGRNISKKSIDMAVRHMDIGGGGTRQVSGALVFPQSIRQSMVSRTQPCEPPRTPPANRNSRVLDTVSRGSQVETMDRGGRRLSRETGGLCESSRYDSILLREDSRNMSWLHVDDVSDPGLVFDADGFDLLPEPFGPI